MTGPGFRCQHLLRRQPWDACTTCGAPGDPKALANKLGNEIAFDVTLADSVVFVDGRWVVASSLEELHGAIVDAVEYRLLPCAGELLRWRRRFDAFEPEILAAYKYIEQLKRGVAYDDPEWQGYAGRMFQHVVEKSDRLEAELERVRAERDLARRERDEALAREYEANQRADEALAVAAQLGEIDESDEE